MSEDRAPEAPARAPLARVTLARRAVVTAGPVRVIEVEARTERRRVARTTQPAGSLWTRADGFAAEELPLGDGADRYSGSAATKLAAVREQAT